MKSSGLKQRSSVYFCLHNATLLGRLKVQECHCFVGGCGVTHLRHFDDGSKRFVENCNRFFRQSSWKGRIDGEHIGLNAVCKVASFLFVNSMKKRLTEVKTTAAVLLTPQTYVFVEFISPSTNSLY